MNRLITKKEFIIIVVCLIVVLLAFLLFRVFHKDTDVVAQVTYAGKIVEIISLDDDGIYHIHAIYPVTLEVTDKAIRFIDSVCPNHDCEGFGYIHLPFESAICLPAQVSVQIVEKS